MEEILGHKKQINFLEKIITSKNLPHAFLFSGQEKIGKKKIAFALAQKILKTKNLFSHPDFIFLEPEKEIISIEMIKELNRKIGLTPFSGEFKIAILDSAEKMTKEAQNCFLKTLEEPRGKTLIILISSFPELLLPTILSRCQVIKFFPLSKKEMEEILIQKGIEKGKREKIIKITQGRVGKMIEILEDKKKFEGLDKIEKEIEIFLQKSISERLSYLENIDPEYFLENLILFFREKIFSEKEAVLKLKLIQKAQILGYLLKVEKKKILEIISLEL